MELKRQDLEELYQLLVLYENIHGNSPAPELLEEVAERYRSNYGEDISTKRNPRNAGRKKNYTEEDKTRILEQRRKGESIRKIAEEIGCSVGYVQGVLSEP